MRSLSTSFAYIAFGLLALGLPKDIYAQNGQPSDMRPASVNQTASATESSMVDIAASELSDSPGTSWAKAQEPSNQQTPSPQPETPPSNQAASSQAGSSQTPAAQDQSQKSQRPVGTAAAEAPTVSGVTAAQPAGVAIAPAKQRHVRTLVLKVGAIVGAGVALGAAIALTEATPSKPPGAH
jgi:hypothetical protein